MRPMLGTVLYPLLAGSVLAVAIAASKTAAGAPAPEGPIDGISNGGSDSPGDPDAPGRHAPGDGPLPSGGGGSATGGTSALGTWQPLTNPIPVLGTTSLVLTDGTIVVQDVEGADWWRLTPDAYGSYVNGTWSPLPLMPDGYAPNGYASAVLPDGRLIVEGGEYSGADFERTETTLGAIYDPVANSWTTVAPPAGYSCIGDSSSVVLPDGRFLLATCWGTDDAVLDAKSLTWTTPFSSGKGDNGHEEGWTLLQNGNVLTVDTLNFTDLRATEVLDTRNAQWSFAGDTPQQLSSLYLGGPTGLHEMGPQVLRPDGTVWVVGGNGQSAVYHPTGGWTAGPDLPYVAGEGQLASADAPGTVLPNGHVMIVTSPWEGPPPLHVFDFDGQKITEIVPPPNAPVDPAFITALLVLPSGEIMFTDQSTDVEIFTSTGTALRSSAPTIDPNQRLDVLRPGATYSLAGKQLNGIYQGSMFGDDVQQASNYPLVRITNLATGHVLYSRTHDHSSMAISPGNHSHTHFDVPAAQEPGASKLEVVANGIASNPIFVNVAARPQ